MPDGIAFLKDIFDHPLLKNLFVYTWRKTKNGFGVTESYLNTPENLVSIAQSNFYKQDIYFGLSLTDFELDQRSRPKKDNFAALPALWLDIDIAHSTAHNKKNLPPNIDSVKGCFFDIPDPSYTVSSGYGYHMYWILEEPIVCKTEVERLFAINAVEVWSKMFINKFLERGFTVDTGAVTQILRLPDTLNCKCEHQVPVYIESGMGIKYAVGDLHSIASRSLAPSVSTPAPAAQRRPEKKYDIVIRSDASIDPDELEMYLDSKTFEDIWEMKREYPSSSERDLAIATQLMAFGCKPQVIVNAIIQHRRENGSGFRDRESYYQLTLAKSETSKLVRQSRLQLDEPQKETIEVIEDGVIIEKDPEREYARAEMKRLTGIEIVRFIKIMTQPPTYRLEFRAGKRIHRISFDTVKEVRSQKFFLDRLIECTNMYIKPHKAQLWDTFLSHLFPFVTEESVGDTGTPQGVFASKVKKYLEFYPPSLLDRDSYLALARGEDDGLPYVEEIGGKTFVYINPENFQEWHNTRGYPDKVKLEIVNMSLLEMGGKLLPVGLVLDKNDREAMMGRPKRWRITVTKRSETNYDIKNA